MIWWYVKGAVMIGWEALKEKWKSEPRWTRKRAGW